MGVVEAMQHSKSSRRIAQLNGSHSEGRLARSMENGECSYRVPKLKRRTVSAVRDFPPAGSFECVATLEHEISDLPNNSRPVEETEFVGTAKLLMSGGNKDDEQGIETQMLSTGSVKMFKIKSFTRVKVEGIFL
ncbi:hypothetical protein ACFX2J_030839 [Malus domestica]